MKRRLAVVSGMVVVMVAGWSMGAGEALGVARPQTGTEKKAIDFLLSKQGEDGSWIPQAGPGPTAMVLKGLLRAGHRVDEPAVRKALAFIDKSHQRDGGWYVDTHATYNTAITLSAIAALPEVSRVKYKEQIEEAQRFLKSLQSGSDAAPTDDKGDVVGKEHPWYGGWGYGEGLTLKPGRRPDLSNSHFVIEALRDSGVPANDETIQRALVFVSRTQASESNDLGWAKGRTDGGWIYSTGWNKAHNAPGESEAPDSKDRDGNAVLTTYGSMTYAGLKSLLFADLKKDDPRVKAAVRWIAGNFTLDVNPGLNNAQGLYYYYHVFGSALNALGEDTLTDAKGVKHDWRKEFETEMAKRQKPDGSFVNAEGRWMESNAVLATSYVVLALQEVRGCGNRKAGE